MTHHPHDELATMKLRFLYQKAYGIGYHRIFYCVSCHLLLFLLPFSLILSVFFFKLVIYLIINDTYICKYFIFIIEEQSSKARIPSDWKRDVVVSLVMLLRLC